LRAKIALSVINYVQKRPQVQYARYLGVVEAASSSRIGYADGVTSDQKLGAIRVPIFFVFTDFFALFGVRFFCFLLVPDLSMVDAGTDQNRFVKARARRYFNDEHLRPRTGAHRQNGAQTFDRLLEKSKYL
jgi:hypothetical protein